MVNLQSILKMDATSSAENSVNLHQTTPLSGTTRR